MTFLGCLSDPFQGLSDLQLGDKKVTLNHLVFVVSSPLLPFLMNLTSPFLKKNAKHPNQQPTSSPENLHSPNHGNKTSVIKESISALPGQLSQFKSQKKWSTPESPQALTKRRDVLSINKNGIPTGFSG